MHTGGAHIEGFVGNDASFHRVSRLPKWCTLDVTPHTPASHSWRCLRVGRHLFERRIFWSRYCRADPIDRLANSSPKAGEPGDNGHRSYLDRGAVFVALPIVGGQFAQSRIARIAEDAQIRFDHWQDALSIRDGGWLTGLFGMGLGKYPVTYFIVARKDRVQAPSAISVMGMETGLRWVPGRRFM